jgi:hypothetical protein
MKKRINQLRALSFEEWRLLLASLVLLPLTGLMLRIIGFKKTRSFLTKLVPAKSNSTTPEAEQLLYAKCVAHMVNVAANHGLYRANCLKKSLVTWRLLARKGIESDLKIGVKTDSDDFQAHSWVECHGHSLGEPANINYHFSAFDDHLETNIFS